MPVSRFGSIIPLHMQQIQQGAPQTLQYKGFAAFLHPLFVVLQHPKTGTTVIHDTRNPEVFTGYPREGITMPSRDYKRIRLPGGPIPVNGNPTIGVSSGCGCSKCRH